MIMFYCSECRRYIKQEYKKDEDGITVVDTSTMCENCIPPTPRGAHHSKRSYCKKGHLLDGVLQTKRDGLVRYCKICMAESDKKFKEKRHQERLHGKGT